jgi:hypothetical protein
MRAALPYRNFGHTVSLKGTSGIRRGDRGGARDALDSMGTLFEQVGDDSSGRLSSKKPRLSSRLSSNARKSEA